MLLIYIYKKNQCSKDGKNERYMYNDVFFN